MTTLAPPVAAVQAAAALHKLMPGLTPSRMHRLLYLCQGHNLGWFDRPLFVDTIYAWDQGPVVGSLWRAGRTVPAADFGPLTNGQLNTIGYVSSRYRGLSRVDLDTLTRAQTPWLTADGLRHAHTSLPIEHEWMAAYFKTVDVDDEKIPMSSAAVDRHIAAAEENRDKPAEPDDLDRLQAWASDRHDSVPAG